jgi:hypothetical protein
VDIRWISRQIDSMTKKPESRWTRVCLYGIGTAVAGTIGAVTPDSPAYRYAFNARPFRTEQHLPSRLARSGARLAVTNRR